MYKYVCILIINDIYIYVYMQLYVKHKDILNTVPRKTWSFEANPILGGADAKCEHR